MKRRWLRRSVLAAVVALVAPWALLFAWSWLLPLPTALREGTGPSSTRILDRDGNLLRHVRAGDDTLALPVHVEDVGPDVVEAIIAAEDRRFFLHPGVDPVAVVRAAVTSIVRGKIVSGASTITQQLARTLVPRPRSFVGKLGEMALALRIERSLSKDQILGEYLSRVPFAPRVRGVEAAARVYFDKPARALSLGEAAALAGMPRGPSLYDPRRRPGLVLARRAAVLARMRVPDARRRLALAELITPSELRAPVAARHFVERVARAHVGSEVRTTLDTALQREAETSVQTLVAGLRERRVTSAAAVVLDNDTGDILAYVGSPDPLDAAALGANDAVVARRQPGSALKPFVYELAVEERGLTAATVLADVPTTFLGPDGEFRPHDYDGRFRGPVRARDALGSSLNVPAVALAEALGPARVIDRLRALGLSTIGGPAEAYGPGIALGNAEVRLLDLAAAYATLARGGVARPVRWTEGDPTSEARLLDADAVRVVVDILADDEARAAGFGRHGVLELPFRAAVKTGTSKGYRDNLTVGFTSEVTVAVWVGNMDGSPMEGISGVTGAGPLFREIMLAAMRRHGRGAALPAKPEATVRVCALSGLAAGPDCPHWIVERFLPGREPHARCTWHGRGGSGVVEHLPAEYDAWAASVGRPLSVADGERGPRIVDPGPGTRVQHDPTLGDREALLVRTAGGGPSAVVFLDGVALARGPREGTAWVKPRPGTHRLWVEAGGVRSDVVTFVVE